MLPFPLRDDTGSRKTGSAPCRTLISAPLPRHYGIKEDEIFINSTSGSAARTDPTLVDYFSAFALGRFLEEISLCADPSSLSPSFPPPSLSLSLSLSLRM